MTRIPQKLHRSLKKVLGSATPRMSDEKLVAYVAQYVEQKDDYLAACHQAGSPLYLQDSAVLKKRAREFQAAFQTRLRNVSFYFAVKSNNHPNVATVLLGEGFGLDVSSGAELELALSLGAEDIVFSGPGKTDSELALAVTHGRRVTVLLDSFGELRRLAAIADAQHRPMRCGVRLCAHPRGVWRKFGILVSELSDFWHEAEQLPCVRLVGLQFHTSWNLLPKPQMVFIEKLGKTLQKMPHGLKTNLEFVDVGGGYWPEQGEWLQAAGTPKGALLKALGEKVETTAHYCLPAADIHVFARKIADAVHKHLFSVLTRPCRICFEPGRWLCHDAMHLLMTVIDKKNTDSCHHRCRNQCGGMGTV